MRSHGSLLLTLRRGLSTSSSSRRNEVVIVGTARTPFGSFRSSLDSIPGPRLGALAIEEALRRSGCPKEEVEEVIMGSVLQAGMGQAPDRQAALFAGLPKSVPCTLVNKVCASGMKAIMLAAQSLALGCNANVVVAGGFESMSNVPFYLERGDTPYGGTKLIDGLFQDGLTDVYSQLHMGNCAEIWARKMDIGREEQDEYGMESYRRLARAYADGIIQREMFEVSVPAAKKAGQGATIISEDEELRKVDFEQFTSLPTRFQQEGGTVTAGNTSKVCDGAAACVLMTESAARRLGCKPLARIVDFADGATEPVDFTIAPKIAAEKLLRKVGMNAQEVDLWEINEAFSVVVLANVKAQELDLSKVNVHGGAVSLGHPFGASGARIAARLVYALKEGQRGVASICNGGGGGSAIMIEKL